MATRLGTDNVELLYGTAGDDLLKGFGGSDTLTGGYGADAIYGGSGTDTATYLESNEPVWVDLARGQGFTGSARGDTLFTVENVSGSRHDDLLIGDENANVLAGFNGHDTLKGGGGADYLSGFEGNDMMEGGAGADTLNGGLGADNMSGGIGDDVYLSAEDTDIVIELAGEGYDVVYSATNSFTLSANVEMLRLDAVGGRGVYGIGNAQTNTIIGNAGNNLLDGGDGADDLSGLGGEDIFVFRAGEAQGDAVYEFNGNGAGAGDILLFSGYGTQQQGASFQQLDATHWQVTSADGSLSETITLVPGYVIDPTHDVMFV